MYQLLNKAYRELQNKLVAHGVQTVKEVSLPIPIPAGTDQLTDGALLPPDLLTPIRMKERRAGSDNPEDYVDMEETSDAVLWKPDDMLVTWTWRDDQIHFRKGGSTVDKEVLLTYNKSKDLITGATSPSTILNSEEWLAQRTAILACITIGGNPKRAEILKADLKELWDDLKVTVVRRNQNRPVRRGRTRYRRY
jgi:hypothetical protein